MTRVPIPLTVFVLVMLPTVISLGFWQLRRAEEKQDLENMYLQKLSAPVRVPDNTLEPFDRISLNGEWGSQQFLVDNQINQGKVGYWVIQTFVDRQGQVFLVNRGWIQAPVSRDELPDAPAPQGQVALLTFVWPQLGAQFLLGEDVWSPGEKIRVQSRDIEKMANITGAIPVELRIEPGSPGVLVAPPQDVQFGRAMHLGYAVQWFGLGVVLVIGYWVVYRRSRRGSPDG